MYFLKRGGNFVGGGALRLRATVEQYSRPRIRIRIRIYLTGLWGGGKMVLPHLSNCFFLNRRVELLGTLNSRILCTRLLYSPSTCTHAVHYFSTRTLRYTVVE